MAKSVLTFTSGKFVFTDDNGVKTEYTDYKAAALLSSFADERARKILDRAFVKHYSVPKRPLPSFLDSHQKDGVNWILTRSRSYLAHAAGAGKTCEAITASIFTEGGGQVVFIVPPQLTANWAREVVYWACHPDMPFGPWPRLAIIPESSRRVYTGWSAEFLIVPDSMLTKDWVLEQLIKTPIRLLAVDEASRFKDPEAQRTIALFGGRLKDGRVSPGLIGNARHAVLMDGSPMPNRPMELWAPTYAMAPESIDFMSREDFGFRYCGARMNDRGNWEFRHSAREDELQERLQKSFMHVVPESALNHPERRRSLLVMSEDPRSVECKRWERNNLHWLNLSDIDEDASQGDLATFRRELGLRKVPWVAEYVSDRLKRKNESILLFCWHREVAFELERRLREFTPGLVIGGTDKHEREATFESFNKGWIKLIIGNISAMGRGHNLQRADRAVFAEFSWCDEENKQCEKRASRKGSTKAFVRCDYVVAPGSMDEPVLNAVFRKAATVKRVIG